MNGNVVPTRLKYATSQAFDIGGLPNEYTHLRAKVENIAFAKDVAVHYKQPNGTWTDSPLGWIENEGDYDVFGAKLPFIEEFVIRYTVNGASFWDNNKLLNYHLSNFTNTVGGNVMLNQAVAKIGHEAGGGFTVTTSWLEGEIYVNNLAFAKRVGIRFSTDGGMKWRDSDATFAGGVTEGTFASSSGAELWKFKTPELNLDAASTVFRFAIYYQNLATGEWFWDNNFGQDYKLTKNDGTKTD